MTHLRGKALERIESLETWILKLNDKTEEVQGKITMDVAIKERKKERKKERLTMYVLVYLMFCAPSLTYNV